MIIDLGKKQALICSYKLTKNWGAVPEIPLAFFNKISRKVVEKKWG